jgi:hypothetical protein
MLVMKLSSQHLTVSYADQIKMVGGVPVFAVGKQEADFKVTVDQLDNPKHLKRAF